ncbi:MAG TPA: hypothetical protein VFP22_10545 [Candidatus Limnocylindrales bacterium]|nr:hypothetical protein [Candidatus Limnocylindrales bacterium]
MAKRSRLAARPGQRRPLQRTGGRTEGALGRTDGSAVRPAGSVTAEEEARAAELEAAILAEERAAAAARDTRTARERGRRISGEGGPSVGYTSVPLATRASEEYRYVQRDVRRIAIVGGFLLLVLAVLDVLVNGMHLFTL